MTQRDNEHAEQQARAQLSSIRDMMAAESLDWERLEELKAEELDAEEEGRAMDEDEAEELAELREAAGEYASQDEALQAMLENPLDISFRSGWTSSPEDMEPEEFQILLCTGGPAVRIIGEIGNHGEPCRAWIEFQDWGTPWTMLFEGQSDALEYAQRVIWL